MAETISPITSENAFHLARNYSETEHFHFLEQVNVGNRLTFACESAIIQACFEIKPGETTEVEVCQRIKDYLGNCGVEDSWYNIPVMVLAGSKRIKKMTADTYDEKSPRNDVVISSNDPLLFIDIHPQATAEHLSLKMVNDSHLGWWSNYAVTIDCSPEPDPARLEFLEKVRVVQWEVINQMNPNMTAAELFTIAENLLTVNGLKLIDVRGNIGHSMHEGPKRDESGVDKRAFLDGETDISLGTEIWGIEIGAESIDDPSLIGRFETCAIATADGGKVLGSGEVLPLSINEL